MIAFAREHSEQPATPAWHAGFLALLPHIRDQLRFALRRLASAERAEAMAECIAHVTLSYARLHEQGKLDVAFPTSLADFAIRQYFAGRRVGNRLNVDDVTSPWAQKRRGLVVKSLDQRAPNGEWKETLVEDKTAGPAEIAAAKLDFEDWFDGLPRLKRGIAETLGTGETTTATANRFEVTPGRISQIRKELAESWDAFQGQALACA